MKAIKYLFISLLLLFWGNSCSEDFLDLQNPNQLAESSFYKTADDFEKLAITCYMPMAFSNMYGSSYLVLNWAMDDRVIHEQFNTQNLQFDATLPQVRDIYYAIYTGIYRCNLFFQKYNDKVPLLEQRKNSMFGEVHFLRGLYYFYAGFLFEVPPLLKEPYVPNTYYPNSTQDSIYNFAEAELKEAVNLLPVSWPSTEIGRATKGAALAFLGKLYLYRQMWSQAAATFKQVMDLGVYELSKPVAQDSLDYVFAYLANFSKMDLPTKNAVYKAENNKESVFEIQYSTKYTDSDGRAGKYLPGRRTTGSFLTWFNSFINGFKNIAMDDKKFPNEFEKPSSHPAGLTRDPRYYATFIWVGDTLDFRPNSPLHNQVLQVSQLNSSLGSRAGMRKYLYPFHTEYDFAMAPYVDPTNWRLMRYADVLLMYAEAKFRETNNGTEPTALAAFNEVRSRVGLAPVAALTKQAFIHERDIEFACEHSRYWDLVRWYQSGWLTIDEVRQYKPYFQPRNVCLPIPLDEINNMKGVLKQNPKWLS